MMRIFSKYGHVSWCSEQTSWSVLAYPTKHIRIVRKGFMHNYHLLGSGFLKAADKQDRGNFPLYGSVPFIAKVKPIINEVKKSAV